MRKLLLFISVVVAMLSTPRPVMAASDTLIINEVSLDTDMSYIELLSLQDRPVSVDGWRVEYITASGMSTTILVTLQGAVKAGSLILIAGNKETHADTHFEKGLYRQGGHIRLVGADGYEIDRIGWGAAEQAEGAPAAVPDKAQSLQRKSARDTDDNAADFISALPTPEMGGLVVQPSQKSCSGLRVNEIAANPSGADTGGGEFIELFNTSEDSITLSACHLSTDKLRQYEFPPGANITPGGFYVVALKDQLLNSGGIVRLDGTEYAYPAIADALAWAFIGTTWQLTAQPTPAQPNVAMPPHQSTEPVATASSPTDDACPAGKFRNPATNRCKALAQPAGVQRVACDPGQERNPVTNRCRGVATASAVQLAACGPGQERNPATNRCRKVAIAPSNEPKPCPAGQVRNPDTNRCRKEPETAVNGHTTAKEDDSTGSSISLGILIAASVAAIGYGCYEYRHELRNWLGRWRQRASKSE